MARDYGRIRSQFWTDEKVKGWPLELKAVASYLLTCEHATALGAFRLPAAYMSDDLDCSPSQARGYLAQLETLGFIKVCKTGWIWIVNYLRHNRPENVNVRKHIWGLASAMPANVAFRDEVLTAIAGDPEEPKTTVSETENPLSEGSGKGSETLSNNRAEPNRTEPIRTEPNLEGEDKRSRSRPLPSDWAPAERHVQKALELSVDLRREAEKFKAHALAKDVRHVRWDSAFDKWLLGAKGFDYGHGNNSGQHGRPARAGRTQRDIQLAAALGSCRDEGGGAALRDADHRERGDDQRGEGLPARVA